MESISWITQTSPPDVMTGIYSEYVLNEQGVFVKREKRVPKNEPLTAITGFRVGYKLVSGTDYRAAPLDRNAILWYKITSIIANSPNELLITGNSHDTIVLVMPEDLRSRILQFVDKMTQLHPPKVQPDEQAAIWICWRDDDDWGDDPYRPLQDMIDEEADVDRFIDPDVLEETRLSQMPAPFKPLAPADQRDSSSPTAKFCSACGASVQPGSRFCSQCGQPLS
jgi:hypothetical protein